MSPHHPFMRSHDREDRGVGQDLNNIFRLTGAETSSRAAPTPEPRRVSATDLDAALEMLSRAAKAMDVLQGRFQDVETYARSVAERAGTDVAVAQARAREAEERAQFAESRLDELRLRAEMAERRAEEAERSADDARAWLERFYDKIVGSFDTRSLLKSQAA